MFGKVWEMKKMYDKYRELQKVLKWLIIRWKEWDYQDESWQTVSWAIVVDITWEMKLREIHINDTSLLSLEKKSKLEWLIKDCFVKAQNKAQEVVAEKTKEVLWFDPSDLANMMWGGGMPNIPWLS